MIFTISSGDLKRILSAAIKIMSAKSPMPILDNVLVFETTPGNYAIMASSQDNSAVIDFPIRIKEGNFKEVCLPAKTLLEVAGALTERPIDVYVDFTNYEVHLKYQGGSFGFMGYPSNEYPKPNETEEVVCQFSMPGADLLRNLNIAGRFTGAAENLRPTLSAVAMDVCNEGVTFVGSDSRSLCRIQYLPGAPFVTKGQATKLLVPAGTVGAISAILSDSKDVTVEYNGKNILFESEGASVRVRDIEGVYPRYEVVIPKNNNYHVTFDRQQLQNTVRLAAMAAPTSTKQIVLEMGADTLYGKTFTVRAEDVDYSTSSSQEISPVPSAMGSGDTPDVNLPAGYRIGMGSSLLSQILSCITTDKVRMLLGDPNRAMLIREDDPKSTLLFLQMPIMII